MKKLLVTGFEPFGGEEINPSWEAARALPDRVGSWELLRLRVPVVYGLAGQRALEAIGQEAPEAVLCLGQAGGRNCVTPEYLAINLRYARSPDNGGNCPQDEAVRPSGPAAIFSPLPVRAMAQAGGERCAVSYSAGTFVCNDLYYTLLSAPEAPGTVFVHLPFLPGQAREGQPSMELEEMTRILEKMILALPEGQN